MGMFDSVWVRCACGGDVEFQSKAGECVLASFDLASVPLLIAADLNGEARDCPECGHVYRLTVPGMPSGNVAMTVTPA